MQRENRAPEFQDWVLQSALGFFSRSQTDKHKDTDGQTDTPRPPPPRYNGWEGPVYFVISRFAVSHFAARIRAFAALCYIAVF